MSGFYKKLSETELQYAPNFVIHKDFTLRKEDKELTEMKEQDGWKWFNTKAASYAYFDVSEPIWTDERIKEFEKLSYTEKKEILNNVTLTAETIDTKLFTFKVEPITEITHG